ncbi:alpha/beta hydrolase [Streptomyces sp. NBC_01601]|uniref:alpha/beta hydrolase n=1 Tax=Streptomyces sp. NBC_01601 TaxID=2975892 RepID=UPI002E28C681|nr:dienelactone hydrolase family protein [Streptomyces sp. NBC_01601]
MKTNVTFLSNGLELAGQLYLPDDYTGAGRPAVVVSHPFGGVKEQTAGLYAERLAGEGFVALAFDGATHIDLYDKEYVPTALTKLTSFFGEHLTG